MAVAAITVISPGESGWVSGLDSGVRFAKFEKRANRKEGRVSHPLLLSNGNGRPIYNRTTSIGFIVALADLLQQLKRTMRRALNPKPIRLCAVQAYIRISERRSWWTLLCLQIIYLIWLFLLLSYCSLPEKADIWAPWNLFLIRSKILQRRLRLCQ